MHQVSLWTANTRWTLRMDGRLFELRRVLGLFKSHAQNHLQHRGLRGTHPKTLYGSLMFVCFKGPRSIVGSGNKASICFAAALPCTECHVAKSHKIHHQGGVETHTGCAACMQLESHGRENVKRIRRAMWACLEIGDPSQWWLSL